MEACSGAHHLAREPAALGHEVRLMPPAYVMACILDGGEAGEAVADDRAGGIEALPGEGRDGGAAEARDAPELQADGLAFGCGLDGGDERRLPAAPRPRLPPGRTPPR